MPIDKDNSQPLKLMIKTAYKPILERTLLGFILKDLAEIAASMKITTKAKLTAIQRAMLVEEQLQSNQIKRTLITRLNALRYMRPEIITEVLLQYDVRAPNDEISFYHDVMEEILEKFEKQLEQWIMRGDYDMMHKALIQPPVH